PGDLLLGVRRTDNCRRGGCRHRARQDEAAIRRAGGLCVRHVFFSPNEDWISAFNLRLITGLAARSTDQRTEGRGAPPSQAQWPQGAAMPRRRDYLIRVVILSHSPGCDQVRKLCSCAMHWMSFFRPSVMTTS